MTRGQAVCAACSARGSSTGRGAPTASFWTALVWRVKGGGCSRGGSRHARRGAGSAASRRAGPQFGYLSAMQHP